MVVIVGDLTDLPSTCVRLYSFLHQFYYYFYSQLSHQAFTPLPIVLKFNNNNNICCKCNVMWYL